MNNTKKSLERISIGIAIMFGIYWIYSFFLQEYLPIGQGAKKLLGLISLYVVGLGLLLQITKSLPNKKIEKQKISFKTVFLCFILQFTALLIFTIIAIIFNFLGIKCSTTNIAGTSCYHMENSFI